MPDARRHWRIATLAATAALSMATGCAPRARPLPGAPVPQVRLPEARLQGGPRRMTFRWAYREQSAGFAAQGEGVARIAAPDSARMDFFVEGGFGGGWALLIGDDLTTPGPDFVRRLVPPAPMLWAALGRLALPAARDTTARVSGDTLRADIGTSPTWRVTFVRSEIARVERIDGGRVQEWITRDGNTLRYEHETGRRTLMLQVQRTEEVNAFDPSIWRR